MQIHGGPGGRAQVVKLEKKLEAVGPCLSIALSEDPSSTAVWTIEVFVQYETLGNSKLGEFVTNPPAAGDPPNRIVAFAGCPGAKGWSVQARTTDPNALADLNLDTSLYGNGLFGVQPNVPIPILEDCEDICFFPIPGETDAWPRLNALMAVWANRRAIKFMAGTFPVRTPGNPPNGTHLKMGPGVKIQSFMPFTGGQVNSIFERRPTILAGGGTLSADVVDGSKTVSSSVNFSPGTWIRLQEVANPIQLAFYQVKGTAGVGPFTLTLDRSILLPFKTNDLIDPLSGAPPSDIIIEGHGATMTGTGDRYVEIIGALRCQIGGFTVTVDGGTMQDAGFSLDTGSRESYFYDLEIDGNNFTQFGLLLETTERCQAYRCNVKNITSGAILGTDCFYSTFEDCHGWNSNGGLAWGTDGNGIGMQGCAMIGCSFIGNTIGANIGLGKNNTFTDCRFDYNGQGVSVGAGQAATNTVLEGCSASNNTSQGCIIDAASLNTNISDLATLDNGSSGLNIFGPVSVKGLVANGAFPVAAGAGAYDFEISDLSTPSSTPTVVVGTNSTGTCKISRAKVSAGNGSNCFSLQAAGVMILSDVKATVGGGGFGLVQAVAGCTFRLEGEVDVDGCSNPYLFDAGGFVNRSSPAGRDVVLNGLAAIDYNFPNLKSSDSVNITRTATGAVAAASGPTVSRTAATKVTLTGTTVGDTSHYSVDITG